MSANEVRSLRSCIYVTASRPCEMTRARTLRRVACVGPRENEGAARCKASKVQRRTRRNVGTNLASRVRAKLRPETDDRRVSPTANDPRRNCPRSLERWECLPFRGIRLSFTSRRRPPSPLPYRLQNTNTSVLAYARKHCDIGRGESSWRARELVRLFVRVSVRRR